MIKWGAQEEFSIQLGANYLHSVIPISRGFYIACSNKNTYIFTKQNIIKKLYDVYSIIIYASDLEVICGVKMGTNSLYVFNPFQSNSFILRDFKLSQPTLNSMHYNPFTKTLLTIGKKIKVWDFDIVIKSALSVPDAYVTLRKTFMPRELSDMRKMSFDDRSERIIITTREKYCVYNYDGDLVFTNASYSIRSAVTTAFLHKNKGSCNVSDEKVSRFGSFKKMVTTTQTGDVFLWHRSGTLLKHFNSTIGAIYNIRFIDSEYLLCSNTSNLISIINIRTSKMYNLFSLPSNADIKYVEKNGYSVRIYTIIGNNLTVYIINLLWKVWYNPIAEPQLQRTTSSKFSSRIAVLTKSGVFYLFTQDAKVIGSIFSPRINIPTSYAYERNYAEDKVVIVYSDGSMELFEHNGSDFQSILFLKTFTRKAFFVQTRINDPWILCTINMFSDLIFFDPKTFEQIGRIHIDRYRIVTAFWERYYHLIVILTAKKIFFYDLVTKKLKFITAFEPFEFMNYKKESFYCLTKKGDMNIFRIRPSGIELETQISFKLVVNSLYCEFGLFVILCENNQIVIGSKNRGHILTIETTSKPCSACFLNTKLDLLVATESDIMIIELSYFTNDVEPVCLSRYDQERNKIDPLFTKKVRFSNSKRMPVYRKRNYDYDINIDKEDNVILRARLEMADDTLIPIKPKEYEDEYKAKESVPKPRFIKREEPIEEEIKPCLYEKMRYKAVIKTTDPKDLIPKPLEKEGPRFDFSFNEEGKCVIKEKTEEKEESNEENKEEAETVIEVEKETEIKPHEPLQIQVREPTQNVSKSNNESIEVSIPSPRRKKKKKRSKKIKALEEEISLALKRNKEEVVSDIVIPKTTMSANKWNATNSFSLRKTSKSPVIRSKILSVQTISSPTQNSVSNFLEKWGKERKYLEKQLQRK